jgi:hypothetical protein
MVGGDVDEHGGELVGLGAADGLAIEVGLGVGVAVAVGATVGVGVGAAWTGRAARPPTITSAATSASGPLTPAAL